MKIKYSGILSEPIVTAGLLAPRIGQAAVNEQLALRITALSEHYGITIDLHSEKVAAQFLSLLLALAEDHVPGFRKVAVRNKAGRHRDWSIEDEIGLYLDVHHYVHLGKSASYGCNNLVKNENGPYSKYKGSPTTLYRRYQAVRQSPFVEMFKKAAAYQVSVENGLFPDDDTGSLFDDGP